MGSGKVFPGVAGIPFTKEELEARKPRWQQLQEASRDIVRAALDMEACGTGKAGDLLAAMGRVVEAAGRYRALGGRSEDIRTD